jgi:hypothetical protein
MIKQAINILFDVTGDDMPHVLAKGAVGLIASAGPVAASRFNVLHDYMSVLALILGLVISLLTVISLALTVERKIRIRIQEMREKRMIVTPRDINRD